MSETETTAVKAVRIKAKNRPPLGIEYGDGTYILPGRIPSEIMTIQAQNKKPKNPAKDVQEQYQREVGVALVDKFYDIVVPADFKGVLDMEDLPDVFEAWSEHVGLGESKDSGN
ncbi:hypothetical protein [Curtobacterium sp. MCBD17_026]|jgi:hypothetical protein|uniref:hypothetical protein n=1 Tax=Curtobacterium sp. MCBD17_026 TaxID=2175621 RepID=UPI000DA8DCE2|nr:hypothetical protein [Curtobacterium sp. MCBD17_026]WIB69802.1 hypothetical protein DEI85_11575 [Curtobacterium sp. MCBD17_026]